jgi:hypothetical protein
MSESWDGHTLHLEYVGGYRPFQWVFNCPHTKPDASTQFDGMPACWQYHDVERTDDDGRYLPAAAETIQEQTECLVIQWTSNLDTEEIFPDRYGKPLPITAHPVKIRWWFDGPETFNAEPIGETS